VTNKSDARQGGRICRAGGCPCFSLACGPPVPRTDCREQSMPTCASIGCLTRFAWGVKLRVNTAPRPIQARRGRRRSISPVVNDHRMRLRMKSLGLRCNQRYVDERCLSGVGPFRGQSTRIFDACLVHASVLKATPLGDCSVNTRPTHRLIFLKWAGRLSLISFTMTPKAERLSIPTSDTGATPNQKPI
jgi:hypothetical protein